VRTSKEQKECQTKYTHPKRAKKNKSLIDYRKKEGQQKT